MESKSATRDIETMDTRTLFEEYLGVCNAALAANRERPLLGRLISASESLLRGRRMGVAVTKGDSSHPYDYFTLELSDGRFELLEHGKRQPDLAWTVQRSYLERVVEHPQEYVDHPLRLDWDWVVSRLGR